MPLRTSRPSISVPNQCPAPPPPSRLGGARLLKTSPCSGSNGAINGAKIAAPTSSTRNPAAACAEDKRNRGHLRADVRRSERPAPRKVMPSGIADFRIKHGIGHVRRQRCRDHDRGDDKRAGLQNRKIAL